MPRPARRNRQLKFEILEDRITPTISPTNSTVSFATSTDVSGTADTATIVVEDTSGAAVSGLQTSDFSFTVSGGASTGSFGSVTETGTPGTYTADFTGAIAGSASTLTLVIDTVQLNDQPQVTVTPGSVDAGNSTVSFTNSTDASGTTDTTTIVVEDAAGNAITGLANGAFNFSLSGGTSTGLFGAVTETSTPGTYTTNFTGAVAGTPDTLTLQIDTVSLTSQPPIQVTAGVDSGNSTVSFASATDVSGTTDTATIVVEDAGGNAISGLTTNNFIFSLAGGASTGLFGVVTETSTPGTYTADFTGDIAGDASTLTLEIGGVTLTSQPTIQVTPGSVDAGNSTVSFANSTDASGTIDTATIVVKDTAGNAVTGLANSAFVFSLAEGASTGLFGAVTETSTLGTYTVNFTGDIAGSADTLTLKVSDVSLTSQPTIQVTHGSVDAGNSTVSFASSTDVSSTTDTATIVIADAAGNAISGLLTSDFSFSLSGGASTGSFGNVTETSTLGTYTANFTGDIAGSAATLTLKAGGVTLTSQPTIQVTPGSVDAGNSTVSFASSTDASGTIDTATIVVKDAAGNAVTGLANSAFVFSLSGGVSTGSFGTVTETSTLGTYTANFTGILAGSAATLTLKAGGVTLTSQPTIQVTPGSVDAGNSTVSFANSTDVSGATDTATIVVKDAAGNAISGLLTSDFSFSLSGGASTGSFGTVTETSTLGTYTANFTGVLAGSADTLTLKVSDVSLTSQPTIQVIPSSVDAGNSTVSLASSTDVSGTTDTATIVVEDATGNAITDLANSAFVFNLSGGTSTGSFGTVTETSTPGTYTANFTGDIAGTIATLTLQVGGVSLTTQPQVTVTPGSVGAGTSTVSFASSTDVSGTTETATIVVKDAAGNVLSGLTNNAFVFSLSGGASTGSFGTVTETATPGTYIANFTGILAGSADTLTLKVSGVSLASQPTIQVIPSFVDAGNSTVNFASSTDASGTTDTATIVVEDAVGNAISGLSNNAFGFSLSGGTSTGAFGTVTETSTPGTYTANFTGILAGSADTLTLSVSGVQLTTQPTVAVIPGAAGAGQTTVSFASPTLASGKTDILTITAKDAAGNVITDLTNNDFTFSLSGGESNGGFGVVTETATAGTYTTVFTGIITGTPSTLETLIDAIPINSTPTVQVKAGPLSGSTSSVGFATSTAASGTSDAVTIVLEDGVGNPITGLPSSAFAFTLVGGTSTGKVGTVSETSTPGTYTANFVGSVAGTAKTLTLKVSGVAISTHPTIQVTPGAVSAARTTASFASASVVSGKSDQISITVKDGAGNAIKGLTTSDFAFSLSGGTSTGIFGTVKAAATPGVYTVAMTGITTGTASGLTVTIDSTSINAHPKVVVLHSALSTDTSSATFATSTVASGTTDTLTIVAADEAGNPIVGLTRTALAFAFSGGKSTGTFGPLVATATPGTYTIAFTGVTAGSASILTVKVNGVQLTSQPTVQVTPGAVNRTKSTVSFATPTVASGNTDTVTISVKDAAGNAITGLANSAFSLSLLGGSSAGSFGTVTETGTPGTYTVTFTSVTAGSASVLFVVVDSILLNEQPKVIVTV